MSHHRLQAALEQSGRIQAIKHELGSGDILFAFFSPLLTAVFGADIGVSRGARIEYDVPDVETVIWRRKPPVNTGSWRGLVINPDGAKAQMEGNAVWGVSATLTEEVRIENGRVAQNNFETYPLLTMKEAPTVEAILVIQAGRNRQAWANRLLVRLGQRSPMPFFH